MHAALLIKGCNRFGAYHFPSGSAYGTIRHRPLHGADYALYQITSVIHFGYDSVGAVSVICRDRLSGPAIWREAAGKVVQDISLSVPSFARGNNPGLVSVLAAGHGRVNPDNDSGEIRESRYPVLVDDRPLPVRAGK